MLEDYVIVKMEDDQEAFTKKVNELLEEGYDLNGPLNVIECKKTGSIVYIQGLFFEEEYLDDEDEDEEDDEDIMYYEVGEQKSN